MSIREQWIKLSEHSMEPALRMDEDRKEEETTTEVRAERREKTQIENRAQVFSTGSES